MLKHTFLCLPLFILVFAVESASADKLCIRVKYNKKKQRVATSSTIAPQCRRGFVELVDTANFLGPTGAVGPAGAAGPAGADGSLRIYGDGSAGPLDVSGPVNLDEANTQYSDIHIRSGGSLVVKSGTKLRCTGNLTIDSGGSLSVDTYSQGASVLGTSLTSTSPMISLRVASPGFTSQVASNGMGRTDSAGPSSGGSGGTSLSLAQARALLSFGPHGGGGGGTGGAGAAAGGGTITVLCQGAIVNNGIISANGGTIAFGGPGAGGGGGGGGGVVILASQTLVTNSASGQILARGGLGGSSFTRHGPGGGGGGGLIHLISPQEPIDNGILDVIGGSNGLTVAEVFLTPRFGGGAGGNSIGGGGAGGAIPTGENVFADDASSGAEGAAILTMADPTSLF